MRYLGGKYFSAKDIARHINRHKDEAAIYLEPFMGSCWVTQEIQVNHRYAGDLHNELVELFWQLQNGWDPPQILTKEEYDEIRANRFTDKYPPHLMAFAGFGCAFGGSYFRKYAGEIHPSRTRRSLLKKIKRLQDVQFFCSDYRQLNPKGCVIYCDPPYENAYTYRITKVVGNGSFDNKEFWEIMDQWSEQNTVYVSERTAPPGYECVMEKEVFACLRTKQGCERKYERLFHKPSKAQLINSQKFDLSEVLGVPTDWKAFKRHI